MISRVLARLSAAWLAILMLLYIGAAASGGTPDIWTYGMLALPAFAGFVLAWVFLPPTR